MKSKRSLSEINSILWATDFSKISRLCLPYIRILSQKIPLKNHVVFVLPKFPDWVYEAAFVSNEDLLEKVKEALEQSELDLKDLVKSSKLPFEYEILEGIASNEILKYASKKQVDLIFAGRRGDSEIEDILIGSTTSRLIRNSDVPVFVVPKQKKKVKIEKILCPIDFTEFALIELEYAVTLAKKLNSQIVVAHITEYFNYKIPVFNQEKLIEKINKKIEEIAETHDYKIDNIIYDEGEPAKKILEIAASENADVITMASHQRKGIEKLFLGSITEKVLMSSDIPVIIIPANH